MWRLLRMLAKKQPIQFYTHQDPVSLNFSYPILKDDKITLQGCVFTNEIAETTKPKHDPFHLEQSHTLEAYREVEFDLHFYLNGTIELEHVPLEIPTKSLEALASRFGMSVKDNPEQRVRDLLDEPQLIAIGREYLLSRHLPKSEPILEAIRRIEPLSVEERVQYSLVKIYDPKDPETHNTGPVPINPDGSKRNPKIIPLR
ncbi:hypothetical protein CL616_03640 [archaeon]|nr:hypothetical protein [archaeon]|tara:strand:+ start:3473 stop:4075 length:603 start_codon:yes stop_codon:yes gene_type:complete